MVVKVAAIQMGCHDISVPASQNFFGKFFPNLMSGFGTDFARREGLYQMPPDGVAARSGLPQMMLEGKRCRLRDAMLGMNVQAVAGFVRVTDITY
jgi:hypothetical protein